MPQFTQGFTNLAEEIVLRDIPISGDVPAWLTGTLLRNGPGAFDINGDAYRHWFDGPAMLHRFALHNGQVDYANRYLQTPGYTSAQASGEIRYAEFATDPCRSIFKRFMAAFVTGQTPSHNANVNLTRLGDQFLAMTETPLPIAFDPDTLETLGVVDYVDEAEVTTTTAHPHYDALRGAGVNHLIHYGARNVYSFAWLPDELPLRREVLSKIQVDQPGYVHSFGLSERYLILAEGPFVINPLDLLLKGKPFAENFRWLPERGARFLVIRKRDGALVGEHRCDPFFVFHHVNAFEMGDYEAGGTLHVDLCHYPDASIVHDLFLDPLRSGQPTLQPSLRRYSLQQDRPVQSTLLTDEPLELPRIHYNQHNGRDYQFVYGIGFRQEQPYDFSNQLLKVDVHSGESTTWREEGCYPGEPVFVPAPSAAAEDDGVILSVMLDSERRRSFLLLLDAVSFAERARAEVPHHIPFGFHGQYFPQQN